VELTRNYEEQNWYETVTDQVNRLQVGGGFPSINISVTEDKFYVRAELCGIDKTDLELTIAERSLTIRGKRTIDYPAGAFLFHRERDDGMFSRTIGLPIGLNSAKADASFANGILTVTFPRSEVSQVRQIQVKSKKSKK
jgi:HSP20 family protein